jgi:hypothetical protein
MADLHLMDLSGHDSDELMRFNEKRKGFESVLKVTSINVKNRDMSG